MIDYALISKTNTAIKRSLDEKVKLNNTRIEMNHERFNIHKQKAKEKKKERELENKELLNKHFKQTNNVTQANLKRLKELEMRHEIINMKKQDQIDKL